MVEDITVSGSPSSHRQEQEAANTLTCLSFNWLSLPLVFFLQLHDNFSWQDWHPPACACITALSFRIQPPPVLPHCLTRSLPLVLLSSRQLSIWRLSELRYIHPFMFIKQSLIDYAYRALTLEWAVPQWVTWSSIMSSLSGSIIRSNEWKQAEQPFHDKANMLLQSVCRHWSVEGLQ